MYLYVSINISVHVKLSLLKYGNYTNFITTMNVFLLAPIFSCMSEVIHGEMSKAV